jgi:hypothetical protein
MPALLRASRSVCRGYVATWTLLRRSLRRPFGEASGLHRFWVLPQIVVILGIAPLVGAVLDYWAWATALPTAVAVLSLGLALTAAVGRSFNRGSFGDD